MSFFNYSIVFLIIMTSITSIIFYSVEIFQNAEAGVDQYLASLNVAAISVMGGILEVFLIQRLSV